MFHLIAILCSILKVLECLHFVRIYILQSITHQKLISIIEFLYLYVSSSLKSNLLTKFTFKRFYFFYILLQFILIASDIKNCL